MIHEFFEENANRMPDAIAVASYNEVLTYRELNEKANRLAHYLIKQGASVEDPVAIYLKPGLDMVISVLGVLKAGCAYVPIDKYYPSERIEYVLSDCSPKIIIVDKINSNRISSFSSKMPVAPLIVDIGSVEWPCLETKSPIIKLKPSNLAYIIYTSGSTGKPKGVMIEHRSLTNLLQSCQHKLAVTSKSKILQIASFGFDVFIAELGLMLISGGSLYLINRDVFSPQIILTALEKYKITTIILSSSILATLPFKELPYLKVIAVGGEPCSQHVIDYWARSRVFLNIYGLTEATVCSSVARCWPYQRKLLIGKPFPNVKIYILNEQLKPVATGVTGEIYIGGRGVGRGYLNNEALTREKFISNFFTDSSGDSSYLFKTGDLGRKHSSGDLEYMGRVDEQIKVRGFRVELAEIEAAIEKYPDIIKASVLYTSEQLIDYILPKTNKLNLDNLHKLLESRLPNYMLPRQFVLIDKLMLTSNGKIDKEKLKSLKIDQTGVQVSLKPSNGEEKIIYSYLHKLLPNLSIKTDKNFFDLGLNSIEIVKFADFLNKEFEVNIDVLMLFKYTTIQSLVNHIINLKQPTDYKKNQQSSVFVKSRTERIVFEDE